MRKVSLLSVVLVCLVAVITFQALAQKQLRRSSLTPSKTSLTPQLPIRKVIIYSNGMAYIERRGTVFGHAEINLSFKQSQVDDVLKSMLVLDLGQGRIGAVSYNSSAPAAARTAEIPFSMPSETENDDQESSGLAGVLSQLQGAKVAVTSSKGNAIGSVITVEKKQKTVKDKDQEVSSPFSYSLVIASAEGEIFNYDLADIRSVKLMDEGAKKDLTEFASATASARRRDAKTITIVSDGAGQREMVVSYTVSAPIWKTTYRVVLDDEGKPFFQGWAIVDNVSDEDWRDVQLSLVSGSPISFIQPIQNPLYRERPVIEIPDDLSLEPQVYDPLRSSRTDYEGSSADGMGGAGANGDSSATVDVTARSISSLPVLRSTSPSMLLTIENSGVSTAAKGNELGDLFEYRIEQPITVDRDRSALIPILQTKMDGERVSIYREDVKQDRPMSGLLLTNTSPLTFENGSMTILDHDAYAGEALIERLKPKEKRLISFAIDLGTHVTAKSEEVRQPAKIIKVVNGIFQIHYFLSNKKVYTFTNQSDRIKAIFIEHPINKGWVLSEDTAKPFDITQNYYRFRFELRPFETKTFPIYENQGLMDSYQLSSLKSSDLEFFLQQKYINDVTKVKLSGLIDLRTEISNIDNKLKALSDEEKSIAEDQSRIRENIEALTKTPEAKQLINRYITKANEQETRLEAITKERQKLKDERESLQQKLAIDIRNFSL